MITCVQKWGRWDMVGCMRMGEMGYEDVYISGVGYESVCMSGVMVRVSVFE